METIEHLIQAINKDLVPAFEGRLRRELERHDKEWLIEQIVRLTLDKQSLQSMDQRRDRRAKSRRINERVGRLKQLALNEEKLTAFNRQYKSFKRHELIAHGYLLPAAPAKGLELISPAFRTDKGNALLTQAKDILYGLLFGSERTNTHLPRVEQELLALTVPRLKMHALDFMQATTELSVFGTWHDPESVSNDDLAENVILEMEYGELASEEIGNGIIVTLGLINNLEVNEQILYARMMNIEQSSLIE